MLKFNHLSPALAVLASFLTACGNNSGDVGEQTDGEAPAAGTVSRAADTISNNYADSENLQAVADQVTDDLPYPVYPNGTQYRTGGENGLTIVLFQTEDSFEEVDAYYNDAADMPRLSAMRDYVRYSVEGGDDDPWATDQPGIVIHEFKDEAERDAVGADKTATTNIIMSY